MSRFPNRTYLPVTTVRRWRLEGDRDTTWQRVAEALGIPNA
jgi:hypothetical protein